MDDSFDELKEEIRHLSDRAAEFEVSLPAGVRVQHGRRAPETPSERKRSCHPIDQVDGGHSFG